MKPSSTKAEHVTLSLSIEQAEDLRTFLWGTTATSRGSAMLNADKYNDETLISIASCLLETLGQKVRKV